MVEVIWLQDDGGRATSRRPRQRNDCVVRAIAIALRLPYDEVYDALAAGGRKSGRGTMKTVWQPWLSERATRRAFPSVRGQKRMTPAQFCRDFSTGRHVIQMAKHVAAVVDGVIRDADQIRTDACVYASWSTGQL